MISLYYVVLLEQHFHIMTTLPMGWQLQPAFFEIECKQAGSSTLDHLVWNFRSQGRQVSSENPRAQAQRMMESLPNQNDLLIFCRSSCVHDCMTSCCSCFWKNYLLQTPSSAISRIRSFLTCGSQDLEMKVVQRDTRYCEAFRHNQCDICRRPTIIARPDGVPQSSQPLHPIPHCQLTLPSLIVIESVPVINIIHFWVLHPLENLHWHTFPPSNMSIVCQLSSVRLEKLHWVSVLILPLHLVYFVTVVFAFTPWAKKLLY